MFYLVQQFDMLTQPRINYEKEAQTWHFWAPVAVILTFILYQPLIFTDISAIDFGDVAAADKLDTQQGTNIFRQLVMALAIIFSVGGLILQISKKQYRQANLALIAPFVIYCFLSIAWSPVPLITLKRCVQILGLIAVGLYAVQSDNFSHKILRVVRLILGATLLINLFMIVFLPSISITPETGAWRGFFQHKNSLGAFTILALAVWLPAVLEKGQLRTRILAVLLAILSLLLAIQSDSKTAILINLALLTLWSFVVFPLPASIKIALTGTFLLLCTLWFFNFHFISLNHLSQQIFERSADLTGRTQLWGIVLEEFQSHPWFGIGYNGFWTSTIIDSDWVTFQAHNGYLDILNELGIIGAALFFISFCGLFIKTGKLVNQSPLQYLPYLLLLVGISMHNFMESNICRAMTRGWFLYLLIYVIIFSSVQSNKFSFREKTQ
ncbi:MAG: O-antigen ligase family protein [Calditrichaeota bacterium]|nr:MAG: O-antigen ligase family protein [Calditrichota bacterium]